MAARKLYIDQQNLRLVEYPGEGGATSLGSAFQGNVLQLEITVVEPTGLISPKFQKKELTTAALRVSIGATPTGTAGGPTPLALQTSFTFDNFALKFVGEIALNTEAIDAYIGSAESRTAYFEVNLVQDGDRTTILQEQITLKAVVDEATSTAPTPTDSYYTKLEGDARYVKKYGDAGETISLISANGLFGVVLYVDDSGNFKTDSFVP